MSELRHDFRDVYGVSYDDVPPEEAVALIGQLGAGTHYRGSQNPDALWGNTEYMLAEIVDTLHMIALRLGCYGQDARIRYVPRPGDAKRAEAEAERARLAQERDRERRASVMERLESTEWEEV